MRKVFRLVAMLFYFIILIYFLDCRQFDHTNPVDPKYTGQKTKIPETTKIVPDQIWDENKISFSLDSSSLIIDNSIAENYEVGDIIISTKGEGILKKITEIKTVRGQTIATIADASLTEAIEECSVSFDSAFKKMEIANIEDYGDGALCKLLKPSDPNSSMITFNVDVIFDGDENFETKDDQARLHGQFSMEQDIRSDLKIKPWGIKRLWLEYELNQSFDLNLEMTMSYWEYKKEKLLKKITYGPINIMAGPVPIVITPVLELVAGININTNSKIKVGIPQSFNYTMGIEYANEDWTTYKEINAVLFENTPVEIEGNASVTAYIRPELKLKMYGTVAPNIFAQLSGNLQGSVIMPSFDLIGKISSVIKAGAAVKMKVFDNTIFDYRADIIEKEYVIKEWINHPNLPKAPTLYVPTNGQIISETKPLLDWSEVVLAETYELIVNDQYDFSSHILLQSDLQESNYQFDIDLPSGSYYWCVRGYDKEKRYGDWSNTWQFNIAVQNTPPTASFAVLPASGPVETVFQFTASSCTDNEDPTSSLQVRWDWENDGVWDINYSTTKLATYQYSNEGIKTIKLEVKDSGGLSNAITKNITVTLGNTSPTASFTINPTSGTTETIFSFDASGSSDDEDSINDLQVCWDWENDGYWDTNYSTTKRATHQYSTEGTKTIKVEVKDTGGLTATTTRQISVGTINYDVMVFVPAGEFTMGDNSGDNDEKPAHTVYLDAYYIDKYEVTNHKYVVYLKEALANGEIQATISSVSKDGNELLNLDASDCQIYYSNATFFVDSGKENYPVIQVTWFGADAYANHYGKRLPSEAEWEKAARGTDQRIYPWGNEAPNFSLCNFFSHSQNYTIGHTTEVGQYSPNGNSPYGCSDMAGNVYEWCSDWYDRYYYRNSPTNNPKGPSSGLYRILRGGSWSGSMYCTVRSTHRSYSNDYHSNYETGFRCVR